MALGDSYATLAELRARLGISDTTDDARLTNALAAASRGIEHETRRQFNDAGSATARVFAPTSRWDALVDDFSTVTGLVIKTDSGGDGTFATTLSSTDYELWPLNGIQDGESGWPYYWVRAVESRWFNTLNTRRATIQITARWGWAAVPAVIKEATLIVAAEIFKLKDAPFGVAGFGDYGAVRVRQNPMVNAMIKPYSTQLILVG